eukprot:3441105-Amphidinium_carterae.2
MLAEPIADENIFDNDDDWHELNHACQHKLMEKSTIQRAGKVKAYLTIHSVHTQHTWMNLQDPLRQSTSTTRLHQRFPTLPTEDDEMEEYNDLSLTIGCKIKRHHKPLPDIEIYLGTLDKTGFRNTLNDQKNRETIQWF